MEFNFEDDSGSEEIVDQSELKINIRVQQRNGKKSWTMIEGLEEVKNLNMKILLKNF